MKVLLSTIGSRGDVAPLLALAASLTSLGHDTALCAPPNFWDSVRSARTEFFPIGPDVRRLMGAPMPVASTPPSPEQLRQLAAQSVRSQFPVLMEAAHGRDLIVAAGALQIATRSVAEALDIPYVFTAYCPVVLPSAEHAPPKMGAPHPQDAPAAANAALWAREETDWNDRFREVLNEERARLGLAAVDSVQRHVFTSNPWLAADADLAPVPACMGMQVTQAGAWHAEERQMLPEAIEGFLAAGAPPVYFGFGSMRVKPDTGRLLIEAARDAGLRCLVSEGWGNLRPFDAAPDCLAVGDVDHQLLFPRVAAVVHHGGAGTTTAAARAGVPQVVIPHLYDQYYWARRVGQLGIGVTGPGRIALDRDSLAAALEQCMQPQIQAAAASFALRIESGSAMNAAGKLAAEFS